MRRPWLRSGIYLRFITAMSALALMPLGFQGLSLLGISEQGLQAAVLELHTKLAEKLADELGLYLRSTDERIRFAIRAAQRPELGWKEREELLRSLVESHPDMESLSVLDGLGRERLRVQGAAAPPASSSERQEEAPACSRPQEPKLEPGSGAAPLLRLDYPLGSGLCLRASLRLNTLWERIGAERVGGTGFALVVDRKGRALLYPPRRLPGPRLLELPRWPIVEQSLAASSVGSSEFRDPDGVLQVGAYAPVPGMGAVLIRQPKAEAYWAAAAMKRTAASVLVVFGLLAVAVALWMARRLSRPLLELTGASAAVAGGSFPEPVRIRTGDELQALAETFNDMVAQLRKYAEIQVDRLLREQRRTEAILFSIDEGILMLDEEGRIRLANRRAREMLGLEAGDGLEGRRLEEVVPDSPLRQAVLWKAANTGEELPKEVNLSTEKRRLFLRVSARPVLSPRPGGAAGVVIALRDVTAERQLDKMKEEFLQSITHDLRNPVGSILGFSEFLDKGAVGPLTPQQAHMVSSMQKAASRLMAMVNNILDAAKMETGRIEVRLQQISLSGVAGHAIDVLGALAQRRGLTVELSADEEHAVQADGDLIERVFANLIGNAIKFARDNGKVTVRVRDEGERLLACVADDGDGIPQAHQQRIFEKFEQVPGQKRGGTGLGLTIAKHIVEAHCGRIWVESEPGQGARFYFTVPKGLRYDARGALTSAPEESRA